MHDKKLLILIGWFWEDFAIYKEAKKIVGDTVLFLWN